MLKMEAIKTTWDTLSYNEQISLLAELKFKTFGLSKQSADIIHPASHLLQIFGPLSYQDYLKELEKYENLLEKVVRGNILIETNPHRTSIEMFTTGISKFTKEHTNNFDWNDYTDFTKVEFLNFCYGRSVSDIEIDGQRLSLYFK